MIELELSTEAFEEIRDKCIAAGLIVDEPREWDEDAEPFTVGGVTFKEWKYVPTPEDIARQEEYRKTPFGKVMTEAINQIAEKTACDILQLPNPLLDSLLGTNYLLDGVDTSGMKIGTTIRIRLPSDHAKP